MFDNFSLEKLEQQRVREKTLKQVQKAKQSRLKRRKKTSFAGQGAAMMNRKSIDAHDRVYVVGRHWDPQQQDQHGPEEHT